MNDSVASLRKKIAGAADLRSVVRTMKTVAAANIGQYTKSVQALSDYNQTVELGLALGLRNLDLPPEAKKQTKPTIQYKVGAVVFGSDQGLVGQFNEVIAEYAIKELEKSSEKAKFWTVGTRIHAHLINSGQTPIGHFNLPSSIKTIAKLVDQILIEFERKLNQGEVTELQLFYNRPSHGAAYIPVNQRLFPLDKKWQQRLIALPWPSKNLPEIIDSGSTTLRALIREYLFVSIFRACAESRASENASRLAAMQRADKNIDELLKNLSGSYHRLRQSNIDEELFDVISGFESLK